MKIREHTELKVYKKGFDAAMRIFELTKRFPKEESRWHRDSDILILTIGAADRSMNNPAASCGVSDLGDEIYLRGVTPECFNRGSSSEPRLDSRLKHAGMTDFGWPVSLTQRAAGNRPIEAMVKSSEC